MLFLCPINVCLGAVRPQGLLAALAAAVSLAAQAAGPQSPTVPHDATPLVYQSALSRYTPYEEVSVQPWQESNSRVARLGGWRAYARESGEALSTNTPSPMPPPTAQPTAPMHRMNHGGAGELPK